VGVICKQLIIFDLSKKVPPVTEPQRMLPCLEDAFIGPCTEEVVSSSQLQISFKIVFNIILTPARRFFEWFIHASFYD
jgi:hypothetical protein